MTAAKGIPNIQEGQKKREKKTKPTYKKGQDYSCMLFSCMMSTWDTVDIVSEK